MTPFQRHGEEERGQGKTGEREKGGPGASSPSPPLSLSPFPSLLLALLLALGACQSDTTPSHPNVVVILADDLGYGDPGRYNDESKIPTPNLDRLADEGMRFTDAHSPSAVCTPTRYGLLTGRYAWRTRLKRGVLVGYSPNLIDTTRMTVASLFKQHGYATGAVGKWHLGLGNADSTDYNQPLRPGPNALGFDYFFGIPASLDFTPYVYVENEGVVAPPTDTIAASRMRRHGGDGFWRGGLIAPGFRHIDVLPDITEKAVAFIERQAAGAPEQPFFLYVPLSAPHTPWLPTEEFDGRSGAGPYGDFTTQVDYTTGQILDALERAGARDNTLVIFTSDNGAHWLPDDFETYGHLANRPWRGQKADIWEGGHRVPFIVRWPGRIAAGSASDHLVSLTDLMATFAALLRAELPGDAGEDSFDFLPVLKGETPTAPLREVIVNHSLDGMFAIRQDGWKLILGRGSGGFTPPRRYEPKPGEPAGQLYNLADDPAEQNNLYDQEPAVVARLTALLEQYQAEGRSRP